VEYVVRQVLESLISPYLLTTNNESRRKRLTSLTMIIRRFNRIPTLPLYLLTLGQTHHLRHIPRPAIRFRADTSLPG
jgi:hypothetical protein